MYPGDGGAAVTRRLGAVAGLLAASVSVAAVTAVGATPPTASQLLAKVRTCHPISGARFATDEQRRRTIPMCGAVGALFWTADMDIDCDGEVTAHCNRNEDRSFQSGTALSPGGRPLAAERTPYVVLPQRSTFFDPAKYGVRLGGVAVIIYKGKVAYAVFGDVGPKEIVGEASYKVAKSLGIDPDPSSGGTASGVTYIIFRNTKVADPRDAASIVSSGQDAAARFLRKN
jgi:Fungal chitosanase of glycosyl hydrolase group 75